MLTEVKGGHPHGNRLVEESHSQSVEGGGPYPVKDLPQGEHVAERGQHALLEIVTGHLYLGLRGEEEVLRYSNEVLHMKNNGKSIIV